MLSETITLDGGGADLERFDGKVTFLWGKGEDRI